MVENQHFNYIIVGGGSAGCVLANRLSANPDTKVCLIEAGPPDTNPFIRMPLGILMVLRSKKLNWHYWTTPQKHCNNRKIYWPRGKTLGGSSSINAMCYVRGNPHDYDHWEQLGNTGWSYQDVLPYFKKLEHFESGADFYHGTGGPINVSQPLYINPLMNTFIAASQQAGYTQINDCNAKTQEGVGFFHVSQKNGQRCSNAQAYLSPIKTRTNLTIITGAYTTKILFANKTARGMRYIKNNQTNDIFATNEVILAAGAVGSPQILLLSGVGPREEVEKHGISLIHELPGVGQNLQDHLDIHITCLEKTKKSLNFRPDSLKRLIKAGWQYFFKRSGEFTSNYTQTFGFAKTEPDLPAPDIQWHFGASMYTNSGRFLKPVFTSFGFTLMACLLNPESRGRVMLQSNNPLDYPLIDPDYLANESDLDKMVIAFKKARDILKQPAFSPYYLKEFEPGDGCQTDEQIKEYIKEHSETIYHPVGTCKMGIDPMAVVDPLCLKVYGINNLRVIDASIMPTNISGNTNAPTTMIAEKGADMILKAG